MTITVQAAADMLDASTLQGLIRELANRFDYMMLASTEERVFDRFDPSRAADVARWPVGQLFGSNGELRWRPKRDRFAACLITEEEALPNVASTLKEREILEAGEREELKIRLWGEHTEDDVDDEGRPFWMEAQLPRLLTYPISGTPPPVAALRAVRYLREDGTVAFARLVTLEGWNDGQIHESL